MRTAWLPKTFTTLRGYTGRQLAADLQAGVVVGIVAIPLALAFAIASGVSPEKGLAQPLHALENAGKLDEHGRKNFVATLDEALEMARSAAARGGNP